MQNDVAKNCEYSKEELDTLYDEYQAYKQLAEETKAKFEAMCEYFYGEGDVILPSGRCVVKKGKKTNKVDTLMLSTLHSDIWDKIIKSGVGVTISPKALYEYIDEVSDCIDTKESTYYSLSN